MEAGAWMWAAEVEDRIVAFAAANSERANVWALFIDPDHEGRGLGRLLHEEMLEAFFTAGAEKVWLTTDPDTRAAISYEPAGWTYVGDEAGEVRFE